MNRFFSIPSRKNLHVYAAVFFSALLFTVASPSAHALTKTWDSGGGDDNCSTAANWDLNTAPLLTDDIVIDSTADNIVWDASCPQTVNSFSMNTGFTGTVQVNTVYGASGFTVFTTTANMTINAGTMKHADNSTAETNRLKIAVGGGFTLGASGAITVDALGYDPNNGPGLSATSGKSGSYGGLGWTDGATYGSPTEPTNLGSGGNGAGNGNGGGAIQLTITGLSTISGTMSSNGGAGSCSNGSGSGGSIYLTTGTISGAGTIRAGAPVAGNVCGQSAGPGGRVAAILTGSGADFSGFSGTMSAYSSSGNASAVAAGTVYKQTQAQGTNGGSLTIDNNSLTVATSGITTKIPSGQTWTVGSTVIQNKGNLELTHDSTLTVATLTIGNNGIVTANAGSSGQTVSYTGNVVVQSGGNIIHRDNSTAETYKLKLAITGNLTIDSGGTINVDSLGYDPGNGPGLSPTSGKPGSYGGLGATDGITYGSITAPVSLGSGGNGAGNGNGGGAIQLTVTGLSTITGTISSDGGSGSCSNGSGSGGSVYLTTGTISGAGTIRASATGNACGQLAGPGGRVAVILTGASADFASFSGAVQAYSISSNSSPAAAGTVYKQTTAQGANGGSLTIDNNSLTVGAGLITSISSSVTGTTVGSVTTSNKGDLTIASGGALTTSSTGTTGTIAFGTTLTNSGTFNVGGTGISNSGTFTINSGSTVNYTGQTDNSTVTIPAATYYTLGVNNDKTTFSQAGSTTVSTALNITNGTYYLNGQTLITTSATISNNDTLRLNGTETMTGFTNDTDSGTVIYTGTTSDTGLNAGNTYYNLNINDGLVGYWPFDTGSGTSAPDVSGYGNNGTLTNGPTWSSTVPTTAFTNPYSLSFDGVDDYVSLGSSIVDITTAHTFSAWIKYNSSTRMVVFAKGDTSFAADYEVNHFEGGANTFGFRFLNGGNSAVWTGRVTGLTQDQWQHVAIVKTGSTTLSPTDILIYINGNSQSITNTDGTTIGNAMDNVRIGGRGLAGSLLPYSGLVDDVRIYNRALTATEVSSLAAGTAPASATATYTLNAALDVNGDFTLASGGLNVSSSNYAITNAGSWYNYGGVFTKQAGTVTFDGTATGKTIQSGNQDFYNTTVSGSGGGWTLTQDLYSTNSLTQTAGTLNTSTSNYNIYAGNLNQSAGTLTTNSSRITVDSSSAQTLNASSTLYNLDIGDNLKRGLVGFWKFDEGTGTSAADSSGNSNTGTLTNGPTWVAGAPKLDYTNAYALDFDGTDDRIDFNDIGDIGSGEFSASFWIKTTTASNNRQVLNKGNSNDWQWFFNLNNTTANKIEWALSKADGDVYSAQIVATTSVNNGAWHHITGTWNPSGTTIKLYVDGALEATGTTTTGTFNSNSAGDMSAGGRQDGFGYFNGSLDDVRIYNRALSSTEITELSTGGHSIINTSTTGTYTLGSALTVSNALNIQAGTLDVSTSNYALTTGTWTDNGAWTPRSGTLTLTKTHTFTETTNPYALTINGASQTVTLGQNTTIGNNLTITTGTLDVGSGSNYSLSIGNNFSNSGTFTARSGTVTFTGTDSDNTLTSGGTSFYTLTINGTNGTVTAQDATIATNALTITNGTLDLSTQNLTLTGATFSNSGTLRLNGTQTLTGFTNDTDSGTVMVNGTTNDTGLATGNTYNNLIVNDGLVGYWPFDTGSGTSAPDVSGYGNNGTLTNGPTWSATVPTTAFTNPYSLSFDGVDDYVAVAGSNSLNTALASANSVSFWMKTSIGTVTRVLGKGQRQIILLTNYPASLYYNLNYNLGGDPNALLSTGVNVTDGTFHHIVLQWDGTTQKMYIDGTLNNSKTPSFGPVANSNVFRVGTDGFLDNVPFNGFIDDVRIYNRALSATEVSSLAAGTQPASASATQTLNAALTVNGDLTLASGGLDVSASNYAITTAGSWMNYGGVFTPRAATVTLSSTATGKTIQSGNQHFYNLTASGTGGGWTLADRLFVDNTLSQTAGTLDVSTSNYNIITNAFSQSAGTFTARSGTVTTKATGASTLTAASTLYNLQIEDPTETSLVGYWKFDEGAGTTTADSSGNSNTGTLTNGAGWGSAVNSTTTYDNPYSLLLDGTDDYVNIGDPAGGELDFGTSTNFTLALWIKMAAPVTGWNDGTVLTKFNEGSNPRTGYSISVAGSLYGAQQGYVVTEIGNASQFGVETLGTSRVDDNAWHHIAVTVDRAGSVKVYANGNLETTASYGTTANISNAVSLWAGRRQTDSVFFNGKLDDIRIYSTALDSTAITKLAAGKYASGSSGTSTTTLGSALTVSNALNIQAGTLDVSISNYALSAGTWTDSGAWTPRSGTLTLTKTHTFTESTNPYALTINGASQTVTLGQNTTLGSNLTITDGTLATGGYNLTLPSSNTFSNTGNFSLQGAETLTNLANDTDSGTVTYTGSSTYSSLDVGDQYYNLTFNGNGTWSLDAALTVNNNLTITAGTLNLNGFNPTIAGSVSNSGTITNTSGRTVTLNGGDQTFNFDNYTFSTLALTGSSGTVSLGSNFTLSDLLSIAAGRILSVLGFTLTSNGSITNSGTITEGAGEIVDMATSFYIADSNFDIDPVISLGADRIYISLVDEDSNRDGTSADSLTGTVVSCPTDSETVTLTETGVATELFRNSGGLTTQAYDGSATNNDGTLECNDSTTITATFTDPQDPSDTETDTADATGEIISTAPSSFAGTAASNTSITWTWTDNANNEDGFKLYNSSNTLIATISTANTTSYTETGLTKGTSYTRKIAAYNEAGNSSYSSSASVTTPADPTAPSNFAGTAASNTSITWTWDDNANDENGFRLLDSAGATIATINTANTESYTETGLTKNTSYTRKVVAFNDDGTSTATSTATVTTTNTRPAAFSLISPADNALSNTGLPTFSFKKSSETGGSISSYTLYVGNQTFTGIPASGSAASNPASSTHSETTYTAQYFSEGDSDTTNDTISITLKDGSSSLPLTDGKYVWYVKAIDDNKDATISEDRTLHIDATSPSISSISITPTTKKTNTSFTTESTNPTLSATVTDTRELEEATITISKANTLLGTITSYTAQETRTYSVTGKTQTITFTSRTALTKGSSYKYTITAQDSAGHETTSTITLQVLTSQQAAEEKVAELDAETTPTTTIVETLRNLLPDSPINLVELQEQAVVRRQLQSEQFRQFFQPFLAWLFNGQGVVERTLVAWITNIGEYMDKAGTYVANIAQQTLAALLNTTRTLVAYAGTYLHSLGALDPTPAIKQAGTFIASIFEQGRDVRVRQGLANRQRIDGYIQAFLAPARAAGRGIALKVRVTYEVWIDTTPTKISNLAMNNLTPTSVTVTWDTNHLTHLGKVNYGTSTSYGQESFEENGLRDHHEVTLTNLEHSTTYYFEVMNQNGGYVYDAYYTVTTPKSDQEVTSGQAPLIPQDVVIKGEENVSVYKEPTPDAEVVKTLIPGTILRALTEKDGWISVLLSSGQEVWIQKEYVDLINHEGESASAQH